MTVDLKWLLPVVMPFAVMWLIRAVWWAAGATITNPGALAFLSLLAGGVFGGVAVAAMAFEGVKFNVTIGRKGGDQ